MPSLLFHCWNDILHQLEYAVFTDELTLCLLIALVQTACVCVCVRPDYEGKGHEVSCDTHHTSARQVLF